MPYTFVLVDAIVCIGVISDTIIGAKEKNAMLVIPSFNVTILFSDSVGEYVVVSSYAGGDERGYVP
jgi:hypothetical protein